MEMIIIFVVIIVCATIVALKEKSPEKEVYIYVDKDDNSTWFDRKTRELKKNKNQVKGWEQITYTEPIVTTTPTVVKPIKKQVYKNKPMTKKEELTMELKNLKLIKKPTIKQKDSIGILEAIIPNMK
jgi:hypothetical protein